MVKNVSSFLKLLTQKLIIKIAYINRDGNFENIHSLFYVRAKSWIF